MPDWVKHAIWWQVYPLGFASAEAASEPAGDGAPPVTHRLGQLNGWLDYAVNLGASGIALGPDLRLADARLRHDRPLPDRPAARGRAGLRRAGRGRARPRAAGAARRGLQPRGPRLPGLPPGAGAGPGRAGSLVVPAGLAAGLGAGSGAGVRHVRGTPGPGGAQPRRAGRGQLRRRGHEPLAGRGRRWLAAGRRLRRAPVVLGPGGARGPGAAIPGPTWSAR